MLGRMAKLQVKSSEEAKDHRPWNDYLLSGWRKRLEFTNNKETIRCNTSHVKVAFDVLGISDFFGWAGALFQVSLCASQVWVFTLG